MSEELPEHVRRNRAQWDQWAPAYAEPGQRNWTAGPSWGLFGVPESELHFRDRFPAVAVDPGGGAAAPGWQLILLVNGVLAMLTLPDLPDAHATDRLLRPLFGMHPQSETPVAGRRCDGAPRLVAQGFGASGRI